MSGDFKTIKLPAVKVAGLGEVKNISVTVPADTAVPFAIVKINEANHLRRGARPRHQILRLDLDKRAFVDIPRSAELREFKASLAASISALVQNLRVGCEA